MIEKNILSVDADAHLKKLTANYYRSSELNIIELIRSALKRDAKIINLKLSKKYIIVEDDGLEIEHDKEILLKEISDRKNDSMKREESIIKFLDRYGIDLLVLFAFKPLNIEIKSGNKKIFINEFGLSIKIFFKKNSKTTIRIRRKSLNRKNEKRIISEYCRNIGDKLIINGKPIKKKPISINPIISMKPKEFNSSLEFAIPLSGKLCKLWVLEKGIPLSLMTFEDKKGFVYDLVRKKDFNSGKILSLEKYINELYFHLLTRYEKYPQTVQNRIEELFYLHFLKTKEKTYIERLKSFKIFGREERVNIKYLQENFKDKALYALAESADLQKSVFKNKTVLILSQIEADILINYFNMEIKFISQKYEKVLIKEKVLNNFVYNTKRYFSKIILGKKEPRGKITEEEELFINELKTLLIKEKYFDTDNLVISFTDKKLFIPTYSKSAGDKTQIIISKKHSLIKKTMSLFKTDKKNLIWLLPQIVEMCALDFNTGSPKAFFKFFDNIFISI